MIPNGYYAIKGHGNCGLGPDDKWFGMRVEGSYGQCVVFEGKNALMAQKAARERPLLEMAVGTGAIAMGPMQALGQVDTSKRRSKPKKTKKESSLQGPEDGSSQVIFGDTDAATDLSKQADKIKTKKKKKIKEEFGYERAARDEFAFGSNANECEHCSKTDMIEHLVPCPFCHKQVCQQCLSPAMHGCVEFGNPLESRIRESIKGSVTNTSRGSALGFRHFCVRCRCSQTFAEENKETIRCTKCANPLYKYGFEFVTAKGLQKMKEEETRQAPIAEWRPGMEFNEGAEEVVDVAAALADAEPSSSVGKNVRLSNLKKKTAKTTNSAIDNQKKKEVAKEIVDEVGDLQGEV